MTDDARTSASRRAKPLISYAEKREFIKDMTTSDTEVMDELRRTTKARDEHLKTIAFLQKRIVDLVDALSFATDIYDEFLDGQKFDGETKVVVSAKDIVSCHQLLEQITQDDNQMFQSIGGD